VAIRSHWDAAPKKQASRLVAKLDVQPIAFEERRKHVVTGSRAAQFHIREVETPRIVHASLVSRVTRHDEDERGSERRRGFRTRHPNPNAFRSADVAAGRELLHPLGPTKDALDLLARNVVRTRVARKGEVEL